MKITSFLASFLMMLVVGIALTLSVNAQCGKSNISGNVYDRPAQRVAYPVDIEIRLTSTNELFRTVSVDVNGNYTVRVDSCLSYNVIPVVDYFHNYGFSPSSQTVIAGESGQIIDFITYGIASGPDGCDYPGNTEIKGKVAESGFPGNGILGVKITAINKDEPNSAKIDAYTDVDGIFTFTGLSTCTAYRFYPTNQSGQSYVYSPDYIDRFTGNQLSSLNISGNYFVRQ